MYSKRYYNGIVYSNGILRRVGNVQDERQAAIRGGLAKGETFWDQ